MFKLGKRIIGVFVCLKAASMFYSIAVLIVEVQDNKFAKKCST